jgi:hypothetical protein
MGTIPKGGIQMEEQSRILLDFLRLSYQRGLMDDFMALGDLLDPNIDTIDYLESFDDAVAAMDLKPFAATYKDQLLPLIQSLTNDESIDALRAILQVSRPYLAKLVQEGSQENPLQNVQKLVALIPHLFVLLKNLAPVAKPYVQPFVSLFVEDSGNLLGRSLNVMSSAIVKSHAEDPERVGRIFSSLFKTLDTNQFGAAMEILMGGFLDQRPPVLRWTLGAILTHTIKNIAGSKRGQV